MLHDCPTSKLQRASVVVAVAFGVLTLVAGGRVLLGLSAPDHLVLKPLLVFNTVMGAAYVAVALRIRSDARRGRGGAAIIALANLVVLVALLAYAGASGPVAPDSLVAMAVRTGVWAGIWLALGRVIRGLRPLAAG